MPLTYHSDKSRLLNVCIWKFPSKQLFFCEGSLNEELHGSAELMQISWAVPVRGPVGLLRSPRHLGCCQNYGPFLGTPNIRCRIIIGTQKGTIILTTTHLVRPVVAVSCGGGCKCWKACFGFRLYWSEMRVY